MHVSRLSLAGVMHDMRSQGMCLVIAAKAFPVTHHVQQKVDGELQVVLRDNLIRQLHHLFQQLSP